MEIKLGCDSPPTWHTGPKTWHAGWKGINMQTMGEQLWESGVGNQPHSISEFTHCNDLPTYGSERSSDAWSNSARCMVYRAGFVPCTPMGEVRAMVLARQLFGRSGLGLNVSVQGGQDLMTEAERHQFTEGLLKK